MGYFLLFLVISWGGFLMQVSAQSPNGTLTTIEEVRSLSAEEANKGYRVQLEGVITYCWNNQTPNCFIQDATGGIFIDTLPYYMEPGTYIKISGETIQGWFAPDIKAGAEITVLGKKPLPEPSQESPQYLFAGKEDASWVEVEGIVRTARVVENIDTGFEIKLDSYGNVVDVQINDSTGVLPENLVGSFVKIRGVAGGVFNIEMQFIGLTLLVPSIDFLHILEPGRVNAFEAVPQESISDVFTFSLNRSKSQYTRISGIVTYVRPGHEMIVKDHSGSVHVMGEQLQNVQLYDSVEVIGFPVIKNSHPYIEDAVIRNYGTIEFPPLPIPLDSLSGIPNFSMVQLTARLNEVVQLDSVLIYTLTMAPYRFDAYLYGSTTSTLPRLGSLLELTGVIDVLYDQRMEVAPEINPIELRMRTAGDIVVLKQGPWWTSTLTRWMVIGLLVIVLMAATWTFILKRQIKSQTQTIRSQLKEVEALKEEAVQASQAKSAFLATMSHEIRTPLNGVIGFTSLMKDTSLDEEQQDFLKIIQTSGEALLGVINDILDFSKIEAGKIDLEMQPFQPAECVKEALAILSHQAKAKGLALTCHMDSSVPETIVGDITRLRQVIINLLSNAIKFTERGEVSVSVRSEPLDEQNTHRIEFSVKDSGIGIPKEKQETIFDSFTQADSSTKRRFGGTGLGLAICKRLSEMMGGSIRAESIEGKGSTFTFDIVCTSHDSVWLPTPKLALNKKSHAELQLAIVERKGINQKIFLKFLNQLKCQADVFNTIEELHTHITSRHFDLIFIDLEFIDLENVHSTRSLFPSLPYRPCIVAMSMNDSPEVRTACKEAGISGFLRKPLRMNEIEEMLSCDQQLQAR